MSSQAKTETRTIDSNLSQDARERFNAASERYTHKKRLRGLLWVFAALFLTYGLCAWFVFVTVIQSIQHASM